MPPSAIPTPAWSWYPMISAKPLLVFPFFASASSSSPTLPSPPPEFTTLRYSSTSPEQATRSPLLRPAFRHHRTTHSRPSSFGGDDSASSARRPSPAASTHQMPFRISYLVALVQANPYWSMMHTNSYKYAYSGAGNYYSYANVYEVDDYMRRADVGRRIWDDSTPVNNTDSANVVPQGGETPHTAANSTTEECKLKIRSPEAVSF
ncbi:hypothetical protein PR202_ga26883 [Eleusine coracana subsp. coracana]|uniref:Uncharacterized protein n=1 Tax=Eleusine coracana subsp. coracana TaxID=191504 RepID=A0AAV5DFQ8_ELECO|nr:hypothetical protein PR202_ga26883 [Eleusine coracana subsp. coracana]